MSTTHFFYWFVKHASSSNKIIFIVTRNDDIVFNDGKWIILQCLKKIHSYIPLFVHVLGTPTIQKPMCEITWISLLEDTIKVNVDESSFNNP